MALGGGAALILAACRRKIPAGRAVVDPKHDPLVAAIEGDWRGAADKARDKWRHPLETLRFFDLRPGMTVVEFWPGAGWYTDILAPYLTLTRGTLYAANLEVDDPNGPAALVVDAYKRKLASRSDLYGAVKVTAFGPKTGPVAPDGSADLVLFLRNLHNWMAAGLAEKAFRAAKAALKPGGVLGVVEHRAKAGGVQDVLASNGYVEEAYVKQMATEAGFKFVDASQINANPKDDRKHPFGVWTLPPTRLSAPRGQPPNPNFDPSKYDAIGESDRMTLKFVKPG
jgi:predicted methyltransferase